MKNYICGICGKEHIELDSYLKCVAKCGEVIKEEENKKRMNEINAAINRVKQAKVYYEEQLASFKEKYPEEYELNFGKSVIKPNYTHTCYPKNHNLNATTSTITSLTNSKEENGREFTKDFADTINEIFEILGI